MGQAKTGLLLALVLGVSGAVVAAGVWFTSGKAGDVDLTSASLVPADAGIYVAFNTDMKSPQWVAAFDLVERLGTEDPEQELRDEVEAEGDVDWEEDVQPFLGGNAAIYVSGFDIEAFEVTGAVILKASDAERAMEVVEEESEFSFRDDSYLGMPFRVSDEGLMWVADVDGHLVLAMNEASMLDVIEVAAGERDSLAGDSHFADLRDELERDFLGFVYFDADRMLGDLAGGDELADAIDAADADLVLKPSAGVVGARDEGFVFQAAGEGEPGVVSPMLAARVSRFATLAPAETAVFFSTFGLAGTIDQVLEEAGDELDDSIAETSPWESLDDLFAFGGESLGLNSLEDLMTLFDGETAVAVWFPDGDEERPEGLVMTEAADAGEARDVIEALMEGAGATMETAGGVDTWTSDDGEVSVALDGTDVYFGTAAGVAAFLEGADETLDGDEVYLRSLATLPTGTGTYLYVDMSNVLRLASGGIPAELDEAEEALEAFIVNWVQEGGLARMSGAITVAEE